MSFVGQEKILRQNDKGISYEKHYEQCRRANLIKLFTVKENDKKNKRKWKYWLANFLSFLFSFLLIQQINQITIIFQRVIKGHDSHIINRKITNHQTYYYSIIFIIPFPVILIVPFFINSARMKSVIQRNRYYEVNSINL